MDSLPRTSPGILIRQVYMPGVPLTIADAQPPPAAAAVEPPVQSIQQHEIEAPMFGPRPDDFLDKVKAVTHKMLGSRANR